MNNGRMWLHIKPSVGLPIFFGGVALTSMTVHYALLTHTTWVPAYLNGSAKPRVASAAPQVPGADPSAGQITPSVAAVLPTPAMTLETASAVPK